MSSKIALLTVLFVLTAPALVSMPAVSADDAPIAFSPRPLSLIPPGTKFSDGPPTDWSQLVSFVRGQLTQGDTEQVTDQVRYYAEVFNLVMLADARKNENDKFELKRVAIGFSMKIDDDNVVVTSDTQKQLGGGLSFIGRSVLSGNYDALTDVKQMARTKQTMLIDAPAIMLRDGKHQKTIVRYFLWVHPTSGKIGTTVWAVIPASDSRGMSLDDPEMQLLPPSMIEDRVMHVDGDEFNFLGVPSPEAFALVQIPQGTAFPMNEAMTSLAARASYDSKTYPALVVAITKSLQEGMTNRNAN